MCIRDSTETEARGNGSSASCPGAGGSGDGHPTGQLIIGTAMPKMKTKSGAKKRFKVRGSGSIKRSMAYKRHILTKKTTKSKRHLRGTTAVVAADVKSVRAMLPYA